MSNPTPIDREKDCPFLLKVYNRIGRHHNVPLEDELQLYTWKDATLGELALLIQEVIPEARHIDARISFRLVFLDTAVAKYTFKTLGKVINSEETPDQAKTLEECKFFIGDFLDVAIFDGPPPNQPSSSHHSSFGSTTSFISGNRQFSSSSRHGFHGGGGGGGFGRYSNNDKRRSFGRSRY
ncbi:unnamed protein product [Cunninghamella blakesleeana]